MNPEDWGLGIGFLFGAGFEPYRFPLGAELLQGDPLFGQGWRRLLQFKTEFDNLPVVGRPLLGNEWYYEFADVAPGFPHFPYGHAVTPD